MLEQFSLLLCIHYFLFLSSLFICVKHFIYMKVLIFNWKARYDLWKIVHGFIEARRKNEPDFQRKRTPCLFIATARRGIVITTLAHIWGASIIIFRLITSQIHTSLNCFLIEIFHKNMARQRFISFCWGWSHFHQDYTLFWIISLQCSRSLRYSKYESSLLLLSMKYIIHNIWLTRGLRCSTISTSTTFFQLGKPFI